MTNSPFSKDYKPQIDWKTQNLDKQRSTSVSMRVEEVRMEHRDYGKMVGITKEERVSLLPKHFHVYSKAVPKDKK